MEATWVFDVDGTLIDSLLGNSLRSGARKLLKHLHTQGHTVVLWSAGGAEYAEQRALSHGLADLVDLFAYKEERDANRRYCTDAVVDDLKNVVFVDDRPEDMPVGAEVIAVSPYLSDSKHDRGLRVAFERAGMSF